MTPAKHTGIRFSEGNHRYTIDGKYVVSVTTALKGIPKDRVLIRWASKLVAEYSVDHLDDVRRMLASGGRGPAVDFLRALPDQKRDTAAVRGTSVHEFAEQIIRGAEVTVPDEQVAYVEGYLHYLEDWEPVSVHDEIAVGSREHGYAGRLDSIQDVPGLGRVIVDYKTGKGVYGEVALQVAAYRFAEFFMDGDVESPMPQVDDAYVLHIQPSEYELRPLVADRDTFGKFLAAKDNYIQNVQSDRLKKLIGDPIEPARREAA